MSAHLVLSALRKHLVLDLTSLAAKVGERPRSSLFRDLAKLKYLSSYTHAGRYYTLMDTPTFDTFGLWFFRDVGFSRAGTLRATVVELVEQSEEGLSHEELEGVLRVRVHNTVRELTREGRIGRGGSRRHYVYVSLEPGRADEQIRSRASRADVVSGSRAGPNRAGRVKPSEEVILAVLVEALHVANLYVDPRMVAKRLEVRGVFVTPEQVEEILRRYGIGKKKPPAPLSPLSKN